MTRSVFLQTSKTCLGVGIAVLGTSIVTEGFKNLFRDSLLGFVHLSVGIYFIGSGLDISRDSPKTLEVLGYPIDSRSKE